MYEVNLKYFLFGIMMFMIFRLIDEMKMFNPDFEAPKNYQKVFYFCSGLIFLLPAGNGILFSLTLRNVFPIILLIICSALFISDSFVKPSWNYLLSIIIGGLIGAILMIPLYEFMHTVRQSFSVTTPYMGFLGIAIAFFIGLIAGILIYGLLYYKNKNGLDELWDATRVWRIINNRTFTLILWIIIIIETFLQLRFSTLILLFHQF